MGNRETRVALIKKIQEHRKARVLVYFTGDRRPFPSQIAEDAVLLLYKHLLALKTAQLNTEKVDLFLYTRGGDVSVPWRIVTMIREFCDEFSVLVPYKAHSAGTMIAIGGGSNHHGEKS